MKNTLSIYYYSEIEYPINFLQEVNPKDVELIKITNYQDFNIQLIDNSSILIVDFVKKKTIESKIKEIQNLNPGLKVILSTSFRTPLEQLKYIQLGYYNVFKRTNSLSLSIIIEQEKQFLKLISLRQNKTNFHNTEEKFKLISDNISDLITLHFPNESYLYVSPSANQLLGYKSIEMIINTPIDYVYDDDKEFVKSIYQDLIHNGKNVVFEYRMQKKNKDVIWVESSASNSENNYGKNIILTISRNIEERKKAQQEILQALKKEKELNEMKTKFITTVSHEFRTPITNINLSAEMLERYHSKLDENSRLNYIKDIKNACFRMTDMMEDILFLGKSEVKKIEFSPKTIDLKNFLEAIIYEVEGLDDLKRISLTYSVPPWLMTIFDIKLLHIIIINLLQNAIKYSPPKEIVQFKVEYINEEFIFTVSDKGIGIPENEIENIFLPFQRASNAKDFFGSGLGMSIVKESVEIHKGTISCQSKVNQGTKFVVIIPNLAHSH